MDKSKSVYTSDTLHYVKVNLACINHRNFKITEFSFIAMSMNQSHLHNMLESNIDFKHNVQEGSVEIWSSLVCHSPIFYSLLCTLKTKHITSI